jgi:hypothetical protein
MKLKIILLCLAAFIAFLSLVCLGLVAYRQFHWSNYESKFVGAPALVLSLDKPTYAINEPIMARIILLNEGKGDLLIATAMDYPTLRYSPIHYNFVLFDSLGKEVEPVIPNNHIEYKEPVFSILEPYENVRCNTCKTSINNFYPDQLRIPGTYSLQTEYWNETDPQDGRKVWKGELLSNIVIFQIMP